MANVRHLSLNDCNLPGFTSTGAWSPMLWSRYTQTSCQHSRSQTLPNLSRWISPPDTHLRSTALTTAPPVLTAAPPMLATALRHSPPLHQCSSPLCHTHHRSAPSLLTILTAHPFAAKWFCQFFQFTILTSASSLLTVLTARPAPLLPLTLKLCDKTHIFRQDSTMCCRRHFKKQTCDGHSESHIELLVCWPVTKLTMTQNKSVHKFSLL